MMTFAIPSQLFALYLYPLYLYPRYLYPQAKGYASLGQPRELKLVVTTKCEAQQPGLGSGGSGGSAGAGGGGSGGGGGHGRGGGVSGVGRGELESPKAPAPSPLPSPLPLPSPVPVPLKAPTRLTDYGLFYRGSHTHVVFWAAEGWVSRVLIKDTWKEVN